jgi:LysM repeat protein
LQDEVNKWRAYYASQQPAQNQSSTAPDHPAPPPTVNPVSFQPAQNTPAPARTPAEDRPAHPTPAKETPRTHTVVAGETAVRIARRYGLPLDALMAANPGLEPRRMRVGQVLNIPSP